MVISKKTALMLGVVFGLVFFSSGFCTQASAASHAMPGMTMGEVAAHTLSIQDMIGQGMDIALISENAAHAVDTCIFECATKTPQVTPVGKAGLSSHALHLLAFDASRPELLAQAALIRGIASEESPRDISSADILLSVQKRE